MSFLTLNSTPIRCRQDACDVKETEHRADRARAFDGTPRLTRGGIFREFTIVTGLLNESDYAAYRALINTDTPPLTAAGDFIGATSISVHPVPGSWTPIATPSESNGFRRQAKFTLWESPTISAPDTSASPWAFYRKSVGLFKDRAGTLPAGDGDKVDRWDDQSGHARHLISHDGGFSGLDGTGWAGGLDYRPVRDTGQKSVRFGNGGNHEMRPNTRTDTLTAMEILVSVRADDAAPATPYALWRMRSGEPNTYYPDTDGHIKEAFGSQSASDVGTIVADLTGFNVYNASGDNATKDLIVRFNNGAQFTRNLGVSPVFAWDQNASSYGFSLGNDASGNHPAGLWIRDLVIFANTLTETQRLAWYRYLAGFTSTPPLA